MNRRNGESGKRTWAPSAESPRAHARILSSSGSAVITGTTRRGTETSARLIKDSRSSCVDVRKTINRSANFGRANASAISSGTDGSHPSLLLPLDMSRLLSRLDNIRNFPCTKCRCGMQGRWPRGPEAAFVANGQPSRHTNSNRGQVVSMRLRVHSPPRTEYKPAYFTGAPVSAAQCVAYRRTWSP